MYYIVFLVFLTVDIALTQLIMPEYDKEQSQCVKELNLDADKIQKLSQAEGEITKDEKCVLRCVLQKIGVIDAQGVPIQDEIDKQFSKFKNIDMSKCIPPSSITDPCEQTYKLTTCFLSLLEAAA
uniref:Odorant binding protein 7 n=1 Tax=Holotrichia oblita TaxID=644536 RepID=A0A3S8S938_HOLOL|nr:odorant binding protein 7 [Holotrichia oblita]